jgi:hypothetical protein
MWRHAAGTISLVRSSPVLLQPGVIDRLVALAKQAEASLPSMVPIVEMLTAEPP